MYAADPVVFWMFAYTLSQVRFLPAAFSAGSRMLIIVHSFGEMSSSQVWPWAVRPPLGDPGVLFDPVAASNSLRHLASRALSGLMPSFVAFAFVSHVVRHGAPSNSGGIRCAENGEHELNPVSSRIVLNPAFVFACSPM